ncbi:MAG TPA: redox-sensing transcriptional repressor Rex [Bacilli bacterium]|nr:redox-sensing transcriptional repressor Rex [Bacilli bacterium]
MKKVKPKVSKNLVFRTPIYLSVSRQLLNDGALYITSPQISEITGINVETVKKDLAQICKTPGNPKLGRKASLLVDEILEFGVYTKISTAVLLGVGHLGTALLNYDGFHEWGLDIVAGFDTDEKLIGTVMNDKKIYSLDDLEKIVADIGAEIAIITTPRNVAQQATNDAVKAGVKAIWNFAPTHINVPDHIVLQNENMASSLSLLNYRLNIKRSRKKRK